MTEQYSPEQIAAVRQQTLDNVGRVYDHAKAYTNGVVLAGYASFFGLWSLTKDQLGPVQTLVSALFISISVLLFVVWEVRSMFIANRALLEAAKVTDNDQEFVRRTREQRAKSAASIGREIAIWKTQLVATIGTAAIGAGTLLASFIVGLFREFCGS